MNAKDEKQQRHELLIDFLSKFKQYQNPDGSPKLKKKAKQLSSDKLKDLDSNEINSAVVVLVDTLNLGGGSISDIDLYRLLQAYFLIPDFRAKFNEITVEAHGYAYDKKIKKKAKP